jgi:hypothetical protein
MGKRSFKIGFIIPKKNGRCLGGPDQQNYNFSLSAHVLRRKPTRKPAQKPAVILYANK